MPRISLPRLCVTGCKPERTRSCKPVWQSHAGSGNGTAVGKPVSSSLNWTPLGRDSRCSIAWSWHRHIADRHPQGRSPFGVYVLLKIGCCCGLRSPALRERRRESSRAAPSVYQICGRCLDRHRAHGYPSDRGPCHECRSACGSAFLLRDRRLLGGRVVPQSRSRVVAARGAAARHLAAPGAGAVRHAAPSHGRVRTMQAVPGSSTCWRTIRAPPRRAEPDTMPSFR